MRLSSRIILIMACCLLPVVFLQAAVSWSQWEERRAQLGALAVHQAELLAGDVESIAEGARILLSSVAELPQVQRMASDCDARLASMRGNVTSFSFIALLDAQGAVRCSSDPGLAAQAGNGRWIDDARAADGFAAGRYVRTVQRPGGFLPFFLPVRGEGGERRTLVAALDLTWLAEHLVQLKQTSGNLLRQGVLTIADAGGVILARDPNHAEFAGVQFPPAAMASVTATKPGLLRLKSIDGTERVIGYIPPVAANHFLASIVGFYEPDLMGDIAHGLLRNFLLLAAAMATGVVLTLMVARRFIAQPTRDLLAATRRWRDGDLRARAKAAETQSEFGQIALACNDMAAALCRRETELREHADLLEARVAERTQQLQAVNQRLQQEIADHSAAEEALVQSQKLQALGQLAGGIAHDFNNVLQAVQGSATLIERRATDPEEVRRRAQLLMAAAERGAAITHRLLTFSRRSELRSEVIDPAELLHGLREVLASALGPSIEVRIVAPPGLPPLQADKSQLETALINLATNARDAMPQGGTLLLSAAEDKVDAGREDGLMAGRYIRLAVQDSGTGIDDATLARVVEPFFTTKAAGKGTGLGLSMVKGFAAQSGGGFAICSAVGQGTTVTLWFPLVGSRPTRLTATGGRDSVDCRNAPRCQGKRVLAVDSEPVVLEMMAAELALVGCRVSTAASAEEALTLLDGGERAALLVTELTMRGMDGLGLIRAARRRLPGLPALLVTGYATDLASLPMLASTGAPFALLRKPVSGPQLVDAVSTLLEAQASAA